MFFLKAYFQSILCHVHYIAKALRHITTFRYVQTAKSMRFREELLVHDLITATRFWPA